MFEASLFKLCPKGKLFDFTLGPLNPWSLEPSFYLFNRLFNRSLRAFSRMKPSASACL